ncbi:hypothetical protein RIR_jg22320.t1 [Rhizophagus irregularis DAOM 181602=DAOM 197198]|nr:hypothetical protein RIR_jg22320.t1 [Rhizophagus irregularis DAOM 181602=DAOM 197198]
MRKLPICKSSCRTLKKLYYEKEIYDLNLRLYFSQQHQQTQLQQQLQQQSQQQQSQSPTFSSLSEYFKFHKS